MQHHRYHDNYSYTEDKQVQTAVNLQIAAATCKYTFLLLLKVFLWENLLFTADICSNLFFLFIYL